MAVTTDRLKWIMDSVGQLKTDELRELYCEVQRLLLVDEQEVVLQALYESGLVRKIRRPQSSSTPFKPVPISGKPLSETIIEERR